MKADGKTATSKLLVLGTYKIYETIPPTGYTINNEPVTVTGDFEGQTVEVGRADTGITDRVIKGQVAVTKFADKPLTGSSEDGGIKQPLEGIEFTLTLKSTGVEACKIVTDADGYAITPLLPYGVYHIEENVDTVRIDIPTSSTVKQVQVWSVTQAGSNEFEVVYEIDQTIKEGDQSKDTTAFYMVKVHADNDGYMIIQNPSLTSTIKKNSYEPKAKEADASIDAVITQDATAFLETFFKLYPNATEKELAYYVKGNVLPQISGDYLFSELLNPTFIKDGDNLSVSVSVKYLDQQTKATQISQYNLTLLKGENWTIIK